MTFAHSLELLTTYRYLIIVPLSIIEGPIVALAAGALAAAGVFNLYILAVIFFLRDVGMDALYYALGYFGGRTAFAKRFLARIHVTEAHLEDVRALWEQHPMRTMFIGKIAYGIATSFIVVAGMVHMRLRDFFGYGAIVAIIQFWGLLALGYVFGNALGGQLSAIVRNIEIALAVLFIIMTAYYLFAARMRARFFRDDQSAVARSDAALTTDSNLELE